MSHEQIQQLAIGRIKPSPEQIRKVFDRAVIAAMAESLRTIGQLQPCRVARLDENSFVIVDGELRWRAATLAGLTTLNVIIEGKDLSEGEVVHRQLIANCHRDNLKPVEKAKAIERLMKETGWSASQAAAKLGLSDASLSRLLSLLKLSEELLRQVDAGEIPESAAAELARIDDPVRRAELGARIARKEITRDALAGIRKRNDGSAQPAPTSASRVTAALGNGRVITFSGAGLQSVDEVISLLEELLAKARKARPQGLKLQTWIKILKDQAKQVTPPDDQGVCGA